MSKERAAAEDIAYAALFGRVRFLFKNASRSCRAAQGAKHLLLCAAAIRRRRLFFIARLYSR